MGRVKKLKKLLKDGSSIMLERAEIRNLSTYHKMNSPEKMESSNRGATFIDKFIQRGLDKNSLSFYSDDPKKVAKAFKKAKLNVPRWVREQLKLPEG